MPFITKLLSMSCQRKRVLQKTGFNTIPKDSVANNEILLESAKMSLK